MAGRVKGGVSNEETLAAATPPTDAAAVSTAPGSQPVRSAGGGLCAAVAHPLALSTPQVPPGAGNSPPSTSRPLGYTLGVAKAVKPAKSAGVVSVNSE